MPFTHGYKIKQFYFKQFSLAQFNWIKWFQVLLRVTEKSINHQKFILHSGKCVYTHLYVK